MKNGLKEIDEAKEAWLALGMERVQGLDHIQISVPLISEKMTILEALFIRLYKMTYFEMLI